MRYYASIHLSRTQRAHYVGFRLNGSNQGSWGETFEQTTEKHESTLHRYNEDSRQKYPLNKDTLERLRTEWNADSLWSLIDKPMRSDLENAIITSLTWFGDAHSEDNLQVSYVKYWTALEALVTAHDESHLVSRLKRGIQVFLNQAGESTISKSQIQKAYELRCAIVHGRGGLHATWQDRDLVNQWACHSIATCLQLLELGYADRSTIEEQIERIDQILQNSKQSHKDA